MISKRILFTILSNIRVFLFVAVHVCRVEGKGKAPWLKISALIGPVGVMTCW